MNYEFTAKNPRQLDICLRMLYSEKIGYSVRISETDQRKIIYLIGISEDAEIVEMLQERYRIMTS